MSIIGNGNVGIGTTSPNIGATDKALTISSANPYLEFNATGGSHAQIRFYSNNVYKGGLLKDETDNPRILKRMEVMAKLFQNQKLNVEIVELSGDNIFAKIFFSLQLADWVSYYIAKEYGIDPADISAIEEFKKML